MQPTFKPHGEIPSQRGCLDNLNGSSLGDIWEFLYSLVGKFLAENNQPSLEGEIRFVVRKNMIAIPNQLKPQTPLRFQSPYVHRLQLRLEDVYNSRHVVTTDGTLGHASAALRTGNHMAAFEEDAVNDGIHADFAEIDFGGDVLIRC